MSKQIVLTVKKSIAHEASRWFLRNGSQVDDFSGEPRGLVMYLRIVSSQGELMPRSSSVFRIRSALQSGFSPLNLRIRACIFLEIAGRPGWLRDFQRQ